MRPSMPTSAPRFTRPQAARLAFGLLSLAMLLVSPEAKVVVARVHLRTRADHGRRLEQHSLGQSMAMVIDLVQALDPPEESPVTDGE